MYNVHIAGGNPPSPQTRSPKPGEEVEPLPDNMQQEDEIRQDFIGPRLERGGATGVAEGDNDGEDPCRSEGIVHFVIRDFSKLSEQLLSEPTYIRNLPWSVVCGTHKIDGYTVCYSLAKDF